MRCDINTLISLSLSLSGFEISTDRGRHPSLHPYLKSPSSLHLGTHSGTDPETGSILDSSRRSKQARACSVPASG